MTDIPEKKNRKWLKHNPQFSTGVITTGQQIYGIPIPGYPNADDGENCWDCGIENENYDMNMCSNCGHTICWDCSGGMDSAINRPHRHARNIDDLPSGKTNRVL